MAIKTGFGLFALFSLLDLLFGRDEPKRIGVSQDDSYLWLPVNRR